FDERCITVWGCITAQGLGRVCRIEGNMVAELYTQILDDVFLGSLCDLGINTKDVCFPRP
ncbi:hypothetical protein PAXRUDRAFT_131396, partial [Paxillus rubicundulus Ve08.2h10]